MHNVLAVINTPTYGGPHNQLARMHGRLQELGWNYIAVLPDEGGDDGAARLSSAGVEVVRIPLHRLRAVRRLQPHAELVRCFYREVRVLRGLIRARNISVVQVCGTINVQPAIAARLERRPVVWQLLGNTAPWLLRAMMSPVIARLAAVVMTTGLQTAQDHAGLTALAKRVLPFLPPVNTSVFRPDPGARVRARAALGVSPEAFLIGTVGNFNRTKAHERLIAAAPSIFSRIPNACIRILGAVTASQQDYYEREVVGPARAMGLLQGGRISFFSPGDRIAEFLPALDVFILTSRSEGMPTAMLEAMSAGIPVVSNAVGSIGEILTTDLNSVLLPSTAPAEIARAVSRIASDASLRNALGETARRFAVQHFSVDVCAQHHAEAFSLALATRK